MYAISAASVAFAVTRACSSGELEKCGCDHNVHGASPEGREHKHTPADPLHSRLFGIKHLNPSSIKNVLKTTLQRHFQMI